MKKIGLALGGGGARGLAHIGVLKIMEEAFLRPDYIAGTSMGALVGAFLAQEKTSKEMEEIAHSFERKKILKMVFDFSMSRKSIIRGKKIRTELEKFFNDITFADLKIPFKVVACDVYSGEEVVIGDGPLVDALIASISVPGIFPPFEFGDRVLIDGGVVNPTPIDIVKEMGAEVVLGIDFITKDKRDSNMELSLVNSLFLSYEIIRTNAAKFKMREEANGNTVLIKPDFRNVIESFKFYEIEKFIKAGEVAARKNISKIQEMVKN